CARRAWLLSYWYFDVW
nr:immunoglobulin heavy chain junction region [Mus musculus]